MDGNQPRFSDLFAQLGLAHDELSIRRFITQHQPLADGVELHQAPFWSPAQAAMLQEKIKADDNWALVVDQLNAALREHPQPDELPSAD